MNAEEAREAMRNGEWIGKCDGCDEYFAADEAPPLRECSREDCGTQFVSSERNCPDCNSPFSRRLADHACESCEGELEEVADGSEIT